MGQQQANPKGDSNGGWREDEQDTKHSKKLSIKKIIKVSKAVCKIIIKGEGNKKTYGTGFFMYIVKEKKKLDCLLTNFHVIKDELVRSKSTIDIQINNNDIYKIKLDNSIRYIQIFKRPIDITIIQIIDNDQFKKDIDFLYYDLNYSFGYEQYLNMDIFIIQHPLGGEAEYACGKVIKIIDDFEFEHSVDTDKGSSGSPIILNESLKVIGIHKQINNLNFNNIGTFIAEIFKEKNINEIFQSEEFNNLSEKEIYEKYKNHSKFEELMELKTILQEIIVNYGLSKCMFDPRGNKIQGWSLNEKRGNKIYDPPIGWIGIGLKVIDRYENNNWLEKNSNQDAWSVAYHAVGRCCKSEQVLKIVERIYKKCLLPGPSQVHQNCLDRFNPGHKVGKGVYLCPKINLAACYAGKVNLCGKYFYVVLMNRVKSNKIRSCGSCNENYYILNGTTDEIRPYRILLKTAN